MSGGIQRLGEIVTIVGSFTLNEAPITFVPSTLTLTVTAPDLTSTVKSWPTDTDLLHHTGHEWYYDLTLNQRGRWQVDWLCVGQFVDDNGDTRVYREPVNQVLRVYA